MDTTDRREDETSSPSLQRRTVLRGVVAGGAVVAGGTLLAACGDDSTTGDASPSRTPTPEATPTPDETGGGGGGGADELVATADVPEGGGVILADEQVVVTQPAAGEFVAFSSICTHRGCAVEDITDGVIVCPCHGSQFSIEDGSVVGGPAPSPLPEVAVTVKGDAVVRA